MFSGVSFKTPLGKGSVGKNVGKYYNDVYTLGLLNKQNKPQAPGISADAKALHKQQLAFAKQYQAQLPAMQATMANQLSHQAGQQTQGLVNQAKEKESSRGLLYGGLAQGEQQGIRSKAQTNLAAATSDLNAGLQNNAQNITNQAIGGGIGMQQNQQAQQNQLYQQALARSQGQDAMISNIATVAMFAAL